MEWFARFKKEIKIGDKGIFFSKDNETVNTRYFICKEDKDNYYIVKFANSIRKSEAFKINKKYEDKVFEVYLESV